MEWKIESTHLLTFYKILNNLSEYTTNSIYIKIRKIRKKLIIKKINYKPTK